jgi:hypothetical protein
MVPASVLPETTVYVMVSIPINTTPPPPVIVVEATAVVVFVSQVEPVPDPDMLDKM